MATDCTEFLDFAKDCLKRNDEIGDRNAIGRAYYAAYHAVCPILKSGPKDEHQGLINYLKLNSWRGNEVYEKNTLIGLGYALQTLKDSRIIADYRLNNTDDVTHEIAKSMVIQSESVMDTIEKITKKSVVTG